MARAKPPTLKEQARAIITQIDRAWARQDCEGLLYRVSELNYLVGVAKRKRQKNFLDYLVKMINLTELQQRDVRCTLVKPRSYSLTREATAARGQMIELRGRR